MKRTSCQHQRQEFTTYTSDFKICLSLHQYIQWLQYKYRVCDSCINFTMHLFGTHSTAMTEHVWLVTITSLKWH